MIYFSGDVGAQLFAMHAHFTADERHTNITLTFRARSPAGQPPTDFIADDFKDVLVCDIDADNSIIAVMRDVAFDEFNRATVEYTVTSGDVDLVMREALSAIGCAASRRASERHAESTRVQP